MIKKLSEAKSDFLARIQSRYRGCKFWYYMVEHLFPATSTQFSRRVKQINLKTLFIISINECLIHNLTVSVNNGCPKISLKTHLILEYKIDKNLLSTAKNHSLGLNYHFQLRNSPG